jgi:hypothetical protein
VTSISLASEPIAYDGDISSLVIGFGSLSSHHTP